MCNLVEKEPTCFEEAVQEKEWMDAMTKEYQSIIKNDVWEVVPRPKNKDVVSSKWIYKIKHAPDISIEKHKARFVWLVDFLKRKVLTMKKHLLL